MRFFQGTRDESGTHVTVDGELLDMKLELRNHSPTGFEWGYHGSGPAQLALALLCEIYGEELGSKPWFYQTFKDRFVARLTAETWEASEDGIRRIADDILHDHDKGSVQNVG